MAEEEEYPLHRCVFKNDLRQMTQLLRNQDVSKKDMHGNTPLHLAVMLGHKDCVFLLLAHSAVVKTKNLQGWTPLSEAISYGDRQIITALLKKLKQQSRDALKGRRPALVKALKQLGDFYLELKWDFQSWVPLVSRILPSDVCRIYKRGSRIRMDTTLVDFNEMKWERGDISFLFNGEDPPSTSLKVLDNKLKVFQGVRYEESEAEIEDEVDILMSTDIVAAQMSTKEVTFSRVKRGWLFKEDKTEMVGNFQADYYAVHGLVLESRKRREHLSDEDLQKNKAMLDQLSKGNLAENCDISRRASLPPPPTADLTWETYKSHTAGDYPILGRSRRSKESCKTFRATVAMSEDFPMTVSGLLDVLEVIAPFKQFHKLRQFMQNRLPDGFPVRLEIPVFPTVTAKITFQEFRWDNEISESKFTVPKDYHEDPSRFPDL